MRVKKIVTKHYVTCLGSDHKSTLMEPREKIQLMGEFFLVNDFLLIHASQVLEAIVELEVLGPVSFVKEEAPQTLTLSEDEEFKRPLPLWEDKPKRTRRKRVDIPSE